jgi:hypothetical protein
MLIKTIDSALVNAKGGTMLVQVVRYVGHWLGGEDGHRSKFTCPFTCPRGAEVDFAGSLRPINTKVWPSIFALCDTRSFAFLRHWIRCGVLMERLGAANNQHQSKEMVTRSGW